MPAAAEDPQNVRNVDALLLAARYDQSLVLPTEEEHREQRVGAFHLEHLFHDGGKPADLTLDLHVGGDDEMAVNGLICQTVEQLVEQRNLRLILQCLEECLYEGEGSSLPQEPLRHFEVVPTHVLVGEIARIRVDPGEGDRRVLHTELQSSGHGLFAEQRRIGAHGGLVHNGAGDVGGVRGMVIPHVDDRRKGIDDLQELLDPALGARIDDRQSLHILLRQVFHGRHVQMVRIEVVEVARDGMDETATNGLMAGKEVSGERE